MQSEYKKHVDLTSIDIKNIFDMRPCCLTCSKIKMYIDYDLVVRYNDSYKVRVHKNVLKEGSLYFDSMLTYFNEKNKTEISIIFNKPFEVFVDLLWYFYTESIEINEENVEDIISTACFFQVTKVVEKCISVLKNKINAEQAHSVWRIANECGVKCLGLEAEKYLIEHFEILLNNKKFCNWSFELVYNVTKSNDIHVSEEIDVWTFIKEWVLKNCDKEDEEKYFGQLIPNLRINSNELDLIISSLRESKEKFTDVCVKLLNRYHGSNGICEHIFLQNNRSFSQVFWIEQEFYKEQKSTTKVYKFDLAKNNFSLLGTLGENINENIVSTYAVHKKMILKFGCWNAYQKVIEYSSTDLFNKSFKNNFDSNKSNLINMTHFSCFSKRLIYLFCDFNSEKLKVVQFDPCKNTSKILSQNFKTKYYIYATAASDNKNIFLVGTELIEKNISAKKCKIHIIEYTPEENKWRFPYSWIADYYSSSPIKILVLGAKLLVFKLDLLYIYDIENQTHKESKNFTNAIKTKLKPLIKPDTAFSLDSAVRCGHNIVLLYELNDYHFNFDNHNYVFVKFSASEVIGDSTFKSMTVYCKTVDNDIKCHIIS